MFLNLVFFFFKEFHLFIYLFIFGFVGSSFLCEGFPQLRQAGATLHRGARASHCRSLSCCRAQAPDAQAQQLWLTGLVAPRHVVFSQIRARTRVPCIGRQILNHCATREAPYLSFLRLCDCDNGKQTVKTAPWPAPFSGKKEVESKGCTTWKASLGTNNRQWSQCLSQPHILTTLIRLWRLYFNQRHNNSNLSCSYSAQLQELCDELYGPAEYESPQKMLQRKAD